MVVQHNMSALNAKRMLGNVNTQQSKSTEKLSSGYRINRAGDDAAGLAISEKMRGQIRGLNQASANAQDGISLIQTAEGALTETHSILQRMRELAVQATSDTNTDDDRTQIQNEIDQLTSEVDRIANTTEFNTKKLLNGSQKGAVSAKDGTAKVDGDFGNSNVSALITKDSSKNSEFTDVIRIEVQEDFSAGKSTKSTTKMTDEQINKLYKLISVSGSTSDYELDNVGLADTTIKISAKGSKNNSFAENLNIAKSQVDKKLTTQVDAANKSGSAVGSNEALVDELVDDVFKLAEKTKASNGNTILKEGITKEELKNAINNLIKAGEESGKIGGINATQSDAIKNAKTDLTNLFSTDTSNNVSKAVAIKSAYSIGVYNEKNVVSATNTISNAAIATSSKLKTVGEAVKKDIVSIANLMANTKINDNINKTKVDQLNDIKGVLEDEELSKAVADYGKAKDDYDNATTATQAQKDELKAERDTAKSKLDALNADKGGIKVQDLFGNSADVSKFEVSDKVSNTNTIDITLKSDKGNTVITINNADKLKAGDTLTITTQEAVETAQAEVGKEALRLQIGANASQELSLGINSMKANDLKIVQTKEGSEGKALDVTTHANASLAINAYDMAIQKVSTERAKMGATQNRLEHTISNLNTSAENLQTAESRIRDTDMAAEMVEFSKNGIIQQAAQSMLAQANQSNQGVLSLLR